MRGFVHVSRKIPLLRRLSLIQQALTGTGAVVQPSENSVRVKIYVKWRKVQVIEKYSLQSMEANMAIVHSNVSWNI